MLGALCARPTAITKPSLFYHRSLRRHFLLRLHYRSSSCTSSLSLPPVWKAILPLLGGFFGPRSDLRRPGEGSWNVAWDARPARWLHRPDSAWFLFRACGFVDPITSEADLDRAGEEAVVQEEDQDKNRIAVDVCGDKTAEAETEKEKSANYRVTGFGCGRGVVHSFGPLTVCVVASERPLNPLDWAIAHSACLRKGEEAPDDNRQRELADELRAQVVEELIKRREETEWFIEGDFDAYIKRIQEPYVWGGEPELLMASHVLKTPIWVYMVESSYGSLSNIAKYGEEYRKDEETSINILFHGYGHYEILESLSGCS